MLKNDDSNLPLSNKKVNVSVGVPPTRFMAALSLRLHVRQYDTVSCLMA